MTAIPHRIQAPSPASARRRHAIWRACYSLRLPLSKPHNPRKENRNDKHHQHRQTDQLGRRTGGPVPRLGVHSPPHGQPSGSVAATPATSWSRRDSSKNASTDFSSHSSAGNLSTRPSISSTSTATSRSSSPKKTGS